MERIPGLPSPTKRPRLGTVDSIPPTPPLSAPRSSSTSVSIDSLAAVLPEPSRQSALRFFATLATLPGKYQLEEDDDDIVDFETDSIIPGKKGFLSRSNAEWKFGCFAPPRNDDPEADVDSGTPGENEAEADPLGVEDEEDELDLIKPRSPSKSPQKDSRAQSVHLPEPSALHLPPLDPNHNAQDAEDLKEFLEANAMHNGKFYDDNSLDGHEEDATENASGVEDRDEDYQETFEDSEVPLAEADEEEDNETQSATNDDMVEGEDDVESDDLGGYDAGEGSIVRNTDGSIRSTPRNRSPSRARSRSMSIKPIQFSSPLKQPIFTKSSSVSPRKQSPSHSRLTARLPSSPPQFKSLPSDTFTLSDPSPPSSPLKDIRIRSRRSSQTYLPTPVSQDDEDPFLRPSTPPPSSPKTPKSTRPSRPRSPEVLPPPPTPPGRRSDTPRMRDNTSMSPSSAYMQRKNGINFRAGSVSPLSLLRPPPITNRDILGPQASSDTGSVHSSPSRKGKGKERIFEITIPVRTPRGNSSSPVSFLTSFGYQSLIVHRPRNHLQVKVN